MTLLSALQKISVVPESVIATRDGEMILDDEILKDGDVVKLIAVISGGACHCEEEPSDDEAISSQKLRLLRACALAMTEKYHEM